MPARMPRRLLMLLCLAALAAGPAACGNSDVKQGVDEPAREGLALELDGVDYNVFITRQLNTKITPDKAYFDGPEAAKDETLYGVFLQACNRSKDTHQTATRLQDQGQPGQRVRAGGARRGQRLRLPASGAGTRRVHPRGGQRGSARPHRRLDAAVPAAARRTPRTARSSSRSRARTAGTSPTSSTSRLALQRAASRRPRPAPRGRPVRPSPRPHRPGPASRRPRSSGARAGAYDVNQASVFEGSGGRVSPVSGSRVSSSSAVPVLPATRTPGHRRRCAGAVGHHVHHQRADRARDAPRRHALPGRALARPESVGGWRTPRMAIACATDAI